MELSVASRPYVYNNNFDSKFCCSKMKALPDPRKQSSRSFFVSLQAQHAFKPGGGFFSSVSGILKKEFQLFFNYFVDRF